jgi:threonyl-tRNA synthetase
MYFFLSTRPEKYLGEIKTWDNAEKQLKEALEKFGESYKISEGDGAFYGFTYNFFNFF